MQDSKQLYSKAVTALGEAEKIILLKIALFIFVSHFFSLVEKKLSAEKSVSYSFLLQYWKGSQYLLFIEVNIV